MKGEPAMLSAKPSMNLRLEKKKNNKNERKNMNNQFDELTKGLAQSVTRRAALKKFGVGLAGMALACFGLANKAEAADKPPGWCNTAVDLCCCRNCKTYLPKSDPNYLSCQTQCAFFCR